MNSLTFIKEANVLISDIKQAVQRRAAMSYTDEIRIFNGLQKRVNTMFSQMQNPSLPCAYKLRDAAYAAELEVDRIARNRIAQFDYM